MKAFPSLHRPALILVDKAYRCWAMGSCDPFITYIDRTTRTDLTIHTPLTPLTLHPISTAPHWSFITMKGIYSINALFRRTWSCTHWLNPSTIFGYYTLSSRCGPPRLPLITRVQACASGLQRPIKVACPLGRLEQ